MARIPYFDLSQASPELASIIKDRLPLNIYRMVAHGNHTAVGFLALGKSILTKSDLDPKLRELVILRVGALCRASYEIFQHRRVASREGVSAEKIEAVLANPDGSVDPAEFSELEMAILRFTDAVVREVKAPEPLFNDVAGRLPHQQLVELMMTIGFYMLVSRLLENLEVDIEETPAH
ncbi:MAG: carboxymuconolactone decarboxylase family protein [Burkholderiaceae bacterium]|jgi:alkylhydroperoxidase family enzyme